MKELETGMLARSKAGHDKAGKEAGSLEVPIGYGRARGCAGNR